jgi:hypothetical protein
MHPLGLLIRMQMEQEMEGRGLTLGKISILLYGTTLIRETLSM